MSVVTQKALGLLAQLAGNVPPSITRAAAQLGGGVSRGLGSGAQALGQGLTAVGLPGMVNPLQQAAQNVSNFQQLGQIPGMLGNMTGSQALGYGGMAAAGLGALGTGAVLGAGAQYLRDKNRNRMAGQNLGQQLGVDMPPVY